MYESSCHVTYQYENPVCSKHTGACLVNTRNSYWDALLRLFTLTGSGGTKSLSLIYPDKNKSQGVRSGLLCGQRVSAMFWSVERCLERIRLSY
jgi:hypothetical protein